MLIEFSLIAAATLLLYLFSYGPRILNPVNVDWMLASGDPATYFLGWHFFRSEPWSFPPGALHTYGMELASSIVFTDSIPLFALGHKLIAPALPAQFQYHGYWILAVLVMQAIGGWLICCLWLETSWQRILGAIMLVLFPALHMRGLGHFALMAHFLILFSFYCYLTSARTMAWVALVVAATLIHAYFLVMVIAIWMAHVMRMVVFQRKGLQILPQVLSVSLGVGLSAWIIGYFTVGRNIDGGGFADYSMNLLAPLTTHLIEMPIGKLLTSSPWPATQEWEGFNYLGGGSLLLLAASVPLLPKLTTASRHHVALLLALAILFIYSLSNKIHIGTLVVQYDLPALAQRLANVFRSSGRFFWPVGYALVIFSLFALSRYRNRAIASLILLAAVIVQLYDTWPIQQRLHETYQRTKWETPLRSGFWQEAASEYSSIRVVPQLDVNFGKIVPLAYYAANNSMAINTGYFARIPASALEDSAAFIRRTLAGDMDPKALYVFFDNATYRATSKHQSALAAEAGQVDGYLVLAPGWRTKPRSNHPSATECSATADDSLNVWIKLGPKEVEWRFGPREEGEYGVTLDGKDVTVPRQGHSVYLDDHLAVSVYYRPAPPCEAIRSPMFRLNRSTAPIVEWSQGTFPKGHAK